MPTTIQIDDEICTSGFCILDNFLPLHHYQNLCKTIQSLHADGAFKHAKIGQKSRENLNSAIRSDQIFWLEEDTVNDAVQAWFSAINNIRTTLNQSLFLGLNSIETHFAVYQPGSFYKKHVDQFKTTMDRRISCVYYLNEDWQPAHGGELKLYSLDEQTHVQVEPRGNRLICFNSNLPHEVKTAFHIRYSLTGWMKVRPMTVCSTTA